MPRPLAASRHGEILRRVEAAGAASVEELATSLGVSRETIRRDLKALAELGRLAVVHGGAVRREEAEASFAARRAENRAGKAAIAALAARLVSHGMTVLLDSGTTTYAIALALSRSGPQRLSVHTTSLLAAQVLCRVPRTRVRLIGGEVDPNDEATTGPGVREAISDLRVDIAFVGVGGLDPEGRMADFTRAAAELRGAMLRSAQHGYFVVDHRKFGRSLPGPIDGDAGAAGVLVDRRPPEVLRHKLRDRGLRVIAPPSDS
jgi:DeoR/GlpR family transcriptional regulator of sugar metabolism